MLPCARIQAVIDLLEDVTATEAAADVVLRRFFSKRRYAGSKDRRFVTEMFYAIIRDWGYLGDIADRDPRKMVLAHTESDELFNGEVHGPAKIDAAEKKFLENIPPREALHHLLNYPLWLEDRLKARFGDNFESAVRALNGRAELNLRVNKSRDKVEAFLEEKSIAYTSGKFAAGALILEGQPRITDWPIYKQGLVEIQDEAAQFAVELCDLAPGQQVMDYCAGAGGKTLAAASILKNKGQIYACDVSAKRLKDLKPRAKRAKSHIIQPHVLKEDKSALLPYVGKIDRVIVDVPCSGSGTWRRSPELKWRLTEKKFNSYIKLQVQLLDEAWKYVKDGGRMIYMTCSLFEDENEAQISAFLTRTEGVELVPLELESAATLKGCLQLTPPQHDTDGFFVAVLQKKDILPS